MTTPLCGSLEVIANKRLARERNTTQRRLDALERGDVDAYLTEVARG